jgi:predicted negative regulator of RcsB-dependent stress response
MTEEEQIEQLKNWIKQFGPTILAGVIMAIVLVTVWHYWQEREARILTHASSVYDEMLTLRAQNDSQAAVVQAEKLLSHYPKTPYADMAALLLARDAATKKDYPTAIEQLNWVIDHSASNAIRSIANIRIARILIQDGKANEAIEELNRLYDKNFNALADETRGDAYMALNKIPEAKMAYQQTIQELPADETTRRPILQMKLDNMAS